MRDNAEKKVECCQWCGFRTGTGRIRNKVGKKLVKTNKMVRYCMNVDCDWEIIYERTIDEQR